MKFDEKQRRKKLKRKIWVAAAGLVMLGVFTVWTWGFVSVFGGGWRPSPNSNDYKHFQIGCVHGGIIIIFNIEANVILDQQEAARTHQIQEEKIRWHTATEKWNGGYIAIQNDPRSHHLRCMGFEFQYFSGHGKNFRAEFDETSLACIFPIWILGVVPALLIGWWYLQLKRSARKGSAFPVEIAK